MTNKINDIDVSECVYLNKVVNEEPYCNIDEEHLYTCSSDENCYFKQFKRLQEENEKLKTENEKLKQPCLVMPKVKQLAVPVEKYEKLYKALEEIRDMCKRQDFNQGMRTYEILKFINEVLNDRD